MKGDQSLRPLNKVQKRLSGDAASDSDCEVMEPDISVIELDDTAEDPDVTITESNKDEEIVDLDECDTTEQGEIVDDEVNPNKSPEPGGEVILTVTFGDKSKYDCLRDHVRNALQKCMEERSIQAETIEEDQELRLKLVEQQDVDDGTDLIFAIDRTPASKPEISAIPSYKRSVREVFNDEKKKEVNEDECPSLKRMSLCFNCSGSHALKDCPQPKNHQRINKAKKMLYATKTERYHVDIEQRYAHIKPGRISDALRKAMGLKKHEIPPFIYKMRILGYPPGWLEDAKVSHSGITLFDSEGRQVQESDDEEGELSEDKHKYDVRKIISFPGFNCQAEPGTIEDHRMPPMLPEDRKEKFIESLGGNIIKGYKRKKLKNLQADSEKIVESAETVDMEIENEVVQPPIADLPLQLPLPFPGINQPPPPPLPSKDSSPPPPPPPECLPPGTPPPESDGLSKQRRRSPTLEDLEAEQSAILKALETSGTLMDTNTDDSLIDEILELRNEEERTESPLTANDDTQTTLSSIQSNENAAELATASQQSEGKPSEFSPQLPDMPNRKSFVLGTPVLKFSSYDKLPTGEKFSVGVSDVINFENLPDSTGKYENMVKVIEKVRRAVQKSNEEN
ncbi:unnamed protein product [Hermetia illucens]|uniref:PSP proline-rich domain-containing protein n=1 Tax=Hermetia illucens TaxID=343691 RepID=A0A7R8UAJ8_HERIL|nr:zinc finger CCHC domain-containing protein 8 homolog [Hermetia illucens]CAD7077165.1 unnamed protein product [Hermetia illucens]